MKKELNYVFLSLIIVLILLSGYLLFERENNTGNKTMTCTLTNKDLFSDIEVKKEIKIDNTGKVLHDKTTSTAKYKTKEDYEKAKEKLTKENHKLITNDSKLIMTEKLEDNKMIDDKNNEVDVWYVEYEKVLKEMGYKCKLK